MPVIVQKIAITRKIYRCDDCGMGEMRPVKNKLHNCQLCGHSKVIENFKPEQWTEIDEAMQK